MKKELLFLLAIFIFNSGEAQIAQNIFNKVIRDNNQFAVQANGTYLNDKNELFVAGNYRLAETHVSKFDSTGVPIWTRSFLEGDNNLIGQNFIQKAEITRLLDSNYLLTRTFKSWSQGGGNRTYLVKFTDNGNLIWAKRIHKNNSPNTMNSFSLEMNNGKIIHAGSVEASGEIDVLRINSTGIVENDITIDNLEEVEPISLVKGQNRAYLVAKNVLSPNTHIIVLDSMGNFIDSKRIPSFTPKSACFIDSTLFILGSNINNGDGIAKVNFDEMQVEYQFGFNAEDSKLLGIENTLYVLSSYSNFGEITLLNLANLEREIYGFQGGPIDLYKIDSTHYYIVANGPTIGIKKMFGEAQIGLSLFNKNDVLNTCFYGPTLLSPVSSISATLLQDVFQIISSNQRIASDAILNWPLESLLHENDCVDALGSLDEQSLRSKIQLTPNPAVDIVNISSEDLVISTVDILGLNGQILNVKQNKGKINVSTLSNGIYFIRITIDSGHWITKKLIVKH